MNSPLPPTELHDYSPYKKPFRYVQADHEKNYSGCDAILDSQDVIVLALVGWSYLRTEAPSGTDAISSARGDGKPGLGLPIFKAQEIQDKLGARVAELMNQNAL